APCLGALPFAASSNTSLRYQLGSFCQEDSDSPPSSLYQMQAEIVGGSPAYYLSR
ncbi:hypothetical protein KI387_028289, partial [Taxus chinensis]